MDPTRLKLPNYSYRDDIPANNFAISCFVVVAAVLITKAISGKYIPRANGNSPLTTVKPDKFSII